MIRIALDLELEQPKTDHQTPDSMLDQERIIQLGYVVFEDEPYTLLEQRCININIGVPLSSFIKKLTGITDEQIQNGTTIQDAYNMLISDREKYNASRKLLTWGGGDQTAIMDEVKPDKLHFGRSALNVKHLYQLYQEVNGANPSGGLKKSMSKLGIKFEGSAHNALVDAINTAKIFVHLKNKLKEIK